MISKNDYSFFRDVTLCVSKRLDVTQMLEELFVYLRTKMPCDLMQVHYIKRDTGELRCLAWVEMKDGKRISHRSHTLFEFPEEVMNKMRKGPPVRRRPHPRVEIINSGERKKHPSRHPAFEEGFKKFGLKSYNVIMVRLMIERVHVGILHIAALPPAVYTQEHVKMIEEVVEPLSMAFSNARRYEDLLFMKNHLADETKSFSKDLREASGAVLVGEFDGLRHVMELVRRVAPLSSPILLLGETGTGKEVLAHAIHAMSPRRDKPFVRVQCGAIPEQLIDSELFGHEKGAFTGATSVRYGRFEQAHGGTIFLDEVGELSSDAQVKLLRVLQEKEFERVGGNETLRVDVRVIAATHRNLAERVKDGKFREDLFFRLNVFPLTIPPLRQRKEDIPLLLNYFIEKKSRELNLRMPPPPAADVLIKLLDYDWPGNVRELQNIVERALITSGGGPLKFPEFGKVPDRTNVAEDNQRQPVPEKMKTLDELIADHIRNAMRITRGRIQGAGGAAELLGIEPNTLRARMKKLGIPYGRNSVKWVDE